MEKQCSKCKKWKEYSDFSRNCNKKDGYNTQCKSCVNGNYRKRYEKYKVEKKQTYKPRQYRNTIFYRLTFCPKDSWGYNPQFTKIEIIEMLKNECLFEGTKFECGKRRYIVENKRMVRV